MYKRQLWDGQSLYLLYSNALLLVLLAVGSTPLPKRLFDWGAEKLRSRQGIAGAGEILLVGAGDVYKRQRFRRTGRCAL